MTEAIKPQPNQPSAQLQSAAKTQEAAKPAAAAGKPQVTASAALKASALAAKNVNTRKQPEAAVKTAAAAAAATEAVKSSAQHRPSAEAASGNTQTEPQFVQPQYMSGVKQAASPSMVESSAEEERGSAGFGGFLSRCGRFWKTLPAGVKRYTLCAVLPSVLCLGYFALWASPMYISEVKFAVKSAESSGNSLNLMSTLFSVPTASLQDAMVVEEFLRSNDAFYQADAVLQLKDHYADKEQDLISRLAAEPTVDDIASFWTSVSEVAVNQDSNVLTFRVRAYNPEMAYRINEQILDESEALVNSMNERAKEDMLKLADLEVAEAKARLNKAQQALQDFRNQNQDLDLKATAEGMQSLVIELESQAAQLRTQIAEQSRFTVADAPVLRALRDRLAGVEQQIERERAKLTEIPSQGVSINTLASQYENLMTEAEFAKQQLVFAMTTLENAKADILSKNLYIVTVAKPSLPDESLYPRPLLFTLYIFLGLSMVYAVLSLVAAAIKEHMGY